MFSPFLFESGDKIILFSKLLIDLILCNNKEFFNSVFVVWNLQDWKCAEGIQICEFKVMWMEMKEERDCTSGEDLPWGQTQLYFDTTWIKHLRCRLHHRSNIWDISFMWHFGVFFLFERNLPQSILLQLKIKK